MIDEIYKNKISFLENSLNSFLCSTNFVPQFGVELEFYLLDQNLQSLHNQGFVENYILNLSHLFLTDSTIYKIEKEQGISQIEIKIAPHSNLILLAKKIEEIKFAAKNLAEKNDLIACFKAQPFIDDCGSALQFNFSLHNQNNENIFIAKDRYFFNSIAGILDSIESKTIFFAPEKDDYKRFDLEINRALHKKGKFTAPINISFGDNNRTTAIRIPRAENISQTRIEFRVAAANADPYLVMAFLLGAIEGGINKNKHPERSQKIYGNAFDWQYNIKKIPQNHQDALEKFKMS